jgi:guanylate kinase
LVRRLRHRGTEAPELVERRLAAAREELAQQDSYDVTLVNTDVDTVSAELVTLMQSPTESCEA